MYKTLFFRIHLTTRLNKPSYISISMFNFVHSFFLLSLLLQSTFSETVLFIAFLLKIIRDPFKEYIVFFTFIRNLKSRLFDNYKLLNYL